MFQHNAWDNVSWGEEQEREAEQAVLASSKTRLDQAKAEDLETNAGQYWDKFYSIHQNRFFKERNWLFIEFPDLGMTKQLSRVHFLSLANLRERVVT